MEETNSSNDSEKPEEIIDAIVDKLDEVHVALIDSATYIGFAKNALISVRPYWEELGNSSTLDDDVTNIYSSDIEFLKALRDEVNELPSYVLPTKGILLSTASSSADFVNSTGTATAFIRPDIDIEKSVEPLVFQSPEQHKHYVKRFNSFDPDLGETYQEIWETLYGTRSEPERAALYLIRQAFDHFFDKLAPDDDVRESPFWSPKEKDPTEQVWRIEKIEYAASTHIKDTTRSNTLRASAKSMLYVYNALNQAHKRGKINVAKARSALKQMVSFLESWADAVGI